MLWLLDHNVKDYANISQPFRSFFWTSNVTILFSQYFTAQSTNKMVIKLTKLERQKTDCYRGYKSISNTKHIEQKNPSKYAPID